MIDVVSDAWIVSALAGLVGLMIGSFLNVCTLRWPEDESVVFPGSLCRVGDGAGVGGHVQLRGTP